MFLSVKGAKAGVINGESEDATHPKEIEVLQAQPYQPRPYPPDPFPPQSSLPLPQDPYGGRHSAESGRQLPG